MPDSTIKDITFSTPFLTFTTTDRDETESEDKTESESEAETVVWEGSITATLFPVNIDKEPRRHTIRVQASTRRDVSLAAAGCMLDFMQRTYLLDRYWNSMLPIGAYRTSEVLTVVLVVPSLADLQFMLDLGCLWPPSSNSDFAVGSGLQECEFLAVCKHARCLLISGQSWKTGGPPNSRLRKMMYNSEGEVMMRGSARKEFERASFKRGVGSTSRLASTLR